MACGRRVLLCLATQVALAAGWATGPSHTSLPLRDDATRALRGEAAAAPQAAEASPVVADTPRWARAAVAVVAALVLIVGGVPQAAQAQESVNVYFGQGCFWHVQNELVNAEMNLLGRTAEEVTARVGYAGGKEVGPKGEVCYHNFSFAPDYSMMGHTEVVNVEVPEDKVGVVGKTLLDFAAKSPFGRHDPQDLGGEYRSAIGLPGGMDGPAFRQIQEASDGRLQFVQGSGNDGDTVGSKKIWVYDTKQYPFYQGEIYHQFHDDMSDKYPAAYHSLKKVAFKSGKLARVMCPDQKLPGSS